MTRHKTPPHAASDSTREALLAAGAEVFAVHGFQHARMRDIAERAGANLSAINYHFGSKEGLYDAVFERLTSEAIERYPLLPPELAGEPAEVRFAVLVRNLLHRLIAPESPTPISRIMARELTNPTEAIERWAGKVIQPQLALVVALVAELLGPAASPERMRNIALSTIGQSTFYLFARPMLTRLFPELYQSNSAIDAVAAHITRFSLDAIAATRAAATRTDA